MVRFGQLIFEPNNLTFNAQFNFCYPQPFHIPRPFEKLLEPNSQRSRSPSGPVSQPDFSNSTFQPFKRAACLVASCDFRRFPPLGFCRGGMNNLPVFPQPSIESFDFFNDLRFTNLLPSVAG